MCAAQWAAVQAGVGVAAAPERAVAAQNAWDVKQVASIAATSLLEVADIWPAFVTARFLQPVRTALEPLLQVGLLASKLDSEASRHGWPGLARRLAAALLLAGCCKLDCARAPTSCSGTTSDTSLHGTLPTLHYRTHPTGPG